MAVWDASRIGTDHTATTCLNRDLHNTRRHVLAVAFLLMVFIAVLGSVVASVSTGTATP